MTDKCSTSFVAVGEVCLSNWTGNRDATSIGRGRSCLCRVELVYIPQLFSEAVRALVVEYVVSFLKIRTVLDCTLCQHLSRLHDLCVLFCCQELGDSILQQFLDLDSEHEAALGHRDQ